MAAQKHIYDYEVDLDSNTASARVIRFVGDGKKVLELGPGPGAITQHLSKRNHCDVTALERDPSAIELLKPHCREVLQADLNDPSWPGLLQESRQFDVVVAADVLEHLYNPLSVLSAMIGFLSENGSIVVSLPHIGHAAVHAALYASDFRYHEWGLLDRTHIRFFGLTNIDCLFDQAGLKIVEAEFVLTAPEDTELADFWAKLPNSVRTALTTSPYANVYQVVVRGVTPDLAGDRIRLIESLNAQLTSDQSYVGG